MRFSAGAVAVLLLAGCGDGGSEPGGLVVARAAPSGDGQSGPPGQALLSPLRVRVTRDGQPAAGAAATWAAVGAGASIAPPANATGPDGIAEASWTLPTAAGPATASATVADAGGSPVTFTATAAAPGQIAIEVGNNFFDPDTRTVIAGTTVVWTWTNTGLISHSVESTGLNVACRRSSLMEGSHGELRTRLTNRLSGDDADRQTFFNQRTGRQVHAVAKTANTQVGFARHGAADLDTFQTH
jgi:plastocyanin